MSLSLYRGSKKSRGTTSATEEKLEIACSLPDGTEIDRNLLKK